MYRNKAKLNSVIFIYSLFISLCFFIGFYLYQENVTKLILDDISSQNYDTLSDTESHSLYQGDIQPYPHEEVIHQANDLQLYIKNISDNSILFVLIIGFIFLISTLFFGIILHSLKKEEILHIASLFKNIHYQDEDINIPYLKEAYQYIQNEMRTHIDDYKRLNSYLSHEQKNAISILRMKLELDGHNEYIHHLDCIKESIDDVLTLSENINEEMGCVDLSLVCAEICDNYRTSYHNIIFHFEEDNVNEIAGKKRWLVRAISNLLDNAIKYGNQKEIHVDVKNRHGSVIVTVKDQGIGFDQNQKEKIFCHHYRINELKEDGYGIGLSLVNHVCDLCHGIAYVESHKGNGTTFYLSFPQYQNKSHYQKR